MTCSMTAFARLEAQESWGTLSWEIRSVNHRFLEPHFRLPEGFRDLEFALRERIRKFVSRGKLECQLRYEIAPGLLEEFTVNEALAEKLANTCSRLAPMFSNVQPVDMLSVLQWPGVLQANEVDRDTMKQTLLKHFEAALKQLVEHRQREGKELQQHIEQRLASISEEVANVRQAMPEILDQQRQKILQRFEELKLELEPTRLEQEMVMITQRADVDEEMDRLQTHVTEVQHTFKKQKGAIGRRLDFLMQEMNREANTLASKSISTTATQSAVNLKVLIEQIREQVQNIE
ncbi:YicC/YloC family endoribonuclease [Zooshikella sp. RANM57]|uniref:YicC/YloC family endoribonuclease n=1 Tax=Zooshikella sp. RANM57 TaxID=3425863 RepID=UPI003D6DC9FD